MEHRYFAASGLACNWASQIEFVQEYLSRLKSIQLPEVIFYLLQIANKHIHTNAIQINLKCPITVRRIDNILLKHTKLKLSVELIQNVSETMRRGVVR